MMPPVFDKNREVTSCVATNADSITGIMTGAENGDAK